MFEFNHRSSIKYWWVCEAIGWFGNLKHLTFVAKDQAGILPLADLVVTDLVSFDTLLRFLEAGYTREKDAQLELYEAQCAQMAFLKLEAEKSGIAMQRNHGMRAGSLHACWEMPEIDRKVTAERKDFYDKAVEKYKKKKFDYRMRLFLTEYGESGQAPFEFVAS
jgi:hypothetical protein